MNHVADRVRQGARGRSNPRPEPRHCLCLSGGVRPVLRRRRRRRFSRSQLHVPGPAADADEANHRASFVTESGTLMTDTAIWPDSLPGRACGPGSHARRPEVADTASRPQPSRPADHSRLIDPATADVRCCSPNVTPCARPCSAVSRNIRRSARFQSARRPIPREAGGDEARASKIVV